jgi:hypothetical protein
VFRPGEPFVKGHPKITGVIDPLDWLPEELYLSGFRDAPMVLEKSIAELLETLMVILHSLSSVLMWYLQNSVLWVLIVVSR